MSYSQPNSKRLIVLPEIPGMDSGYRIAVKSDVERLRLSHRDKIITYSVKEKKRIKGIISTNIKRAPKSLLVRDFWKNLLKGRPVNNLNENQLLKAIGGIEKTKNISEIFCGDVVMYDAARSLFPDAHLTVRFHNLFSLVKARQEKLNYPIGAKFKIVLHTFTELETRILNDPKVTPIFITSDEAVFFTKIYPDRKDFKLWEVNKRYKQLDANYKVMKLNRLVWFGSLAAHKDFCIKYFIEKVFPALKKQNSDLEFHLYGGGTKKFNDPENGIKGFGYYHGNGLPDFQGLYINPDLLGGGIKLKLQQLIKNKVSFITTPFGASGYNMSKIDNAHVSHIENWKTDIPKIMNGRSIPKHDFSTLMNFYPQIQRKKLRYLNA